jgi:ABC-2 type transport system permease protein
VALVIASILLGTVFSALSNVLGMTVRQRESIIGLSIFLLLPLTFLSTAFMARDLMPGWMQAVAGANPVNWALDAARGALDRTVDWSAVLAYGGPWRPARGFVALSTLTFRAYQRPSE